MTSQSVDQLTDRGGASTEGEEMAGQRDAVSSGYIYILEELRSHGADRHFFTAGAATNVTKRRSELQLGNPRQLVVHRQRRVGDMTKAGRELLQGLAEYRNPHGGGSGWFQVRQNELAKFQATVKEILDQVH